MTPRQVIVVSEFFPPDAAHRVVTPDITFLGMHPDYLRRFKLSAQVLDLPLTFEDDTVWDLDTDPVRREFVRDAIAATQPASKLLQSILKTLARPR